MKDYVEKLQKDINTLSDNSIGCSGVINLQELRTTIAGIGSGYIDPELFYEAIEKIKNPITEEPSKKMGSYPERAQRKVRLD